MSILDTANLSSLPIETPETGIGHKAGGGGRSGRAPLCPSEFAEPFRAEDCVVTIISKQEGPSRKEQELKHKIKENRGTIQGMVDALQYGPAGRPKQQKVEAPPQGGGTSFFYKKTSSEGDAKPYVRVSMNGRVVLVDYETGSQLHHLGDVRGKGAAGRFALATKANGFFAPLDAEIADALKSLDGAVAGGREAEEKFKADVAAALGLA